MTLKLARSVQTLVLSFHVCLHVLMNQNQQFPNFLLKYKETSGDSRLLHNTVDQENMHFFSLFGTEKIKGSIIQTIKCKCSSLQ